MPSRTTAPAATTATGPDYWVTLPNGRKVNVFSEVGANELVTYHHETRASNTQDFLQNLIQNSAIHHIQTTLNSNSNSNSTPSTISRNANTGNARRCGGSKKNRRRHAQHQQQLSVGQTTLERRVLEEQSSYCVYTIFDGIARTCSREIFDRCISDVDLERYLNHCAAVLTEKTGRIAWNHPGSLAKQDGILFASLLTLTRHGRFVKMAVQEPSNLARVVANFIAPVPHASNPNVGLCSFFMELFVVFTVHCYDKLACEDERPSEQAFKKLESTGLLAQFLRCITQPTSKQSACMGLLDGLLMCPVLVQRKLCAGQAMGDLLNRLLTFQEGYNGHRNPELTWRLKSLQTLADLTSSTIGRVLATSSSSSTTSTTMSIAAAAVTGSPATGGRKFIQCRCCHRCNKFSKDVEFQLALLKCGRCKFVYYCSEECQRADWKTHKADCTPHVKSELERMSATQQLLASFTEKYNDQIMESVSEAVDHFQLPRSELFLELDFYASYAGSKRREAPALKNPPEFRVLSRSEAPDWLDEDPFIGIARRPDTLVCVLRDSAGHGLVVAKTLQGREWS